MIHLTLDTISTIKPIHKKRLLINNYSHFYLVSERKQGFIVKIKEDENITHSNTGSISRVKI